MGLFDWITGRKVEPIELDDSCESERQAIKDRLRARGWIDNDDKPIAPIYLQYDEITPEIITKIRLVVGHEFAYEIAVNDMSERADIAFLLSLISKERHSSSIPPGAESNVGT